MTVRAFLLAAPDRKALLVEIDRLRAMSAAERRALAAPDVRGVRLHPSATLGVTLSLPKGQPDRRDPCRLAIVAPLHRLDASLELARARLAAATQPRLVVRSHGLYFSESADPGRVGFVFPGQGSEYVSMLEHLYRRAPLVRGWFDDLDREALDVEGFPLTSLIYPEPGQTADPEGTPVRDMDRGAVLGTVAALALHDVLGRLGIRADAHAGHSNGEHAAVIAAGRVQGSRRDLCRWLTNVGRAGAALARPAVPERMVSIAALNRTRVAALLAPYQGHVYLAMDNSPLQVVAGGEAEAIERLAGEVVAAGGVAMMLPFRHAFHTPLFTEWAGILETHYRTLRFGPGRVPVYSCLTTEPLPVDADELRETMVRQWTSPVRFGATVERMYAQGFRTFIEVGPGATLTSLVADSLRGRPHVAVSTSMKHRDDIDHLYYLAGELFAAGLPVDAAAIAAFETWSPGPESWSPGPSGPGPAPSIAPWSIARDVHEELAASARARLMRVGAVPAHPAGPLVGSVVSATKTELRATRVFSRDADPFVIDHALGREGSGPGHPLPVLAFTTSLEIVAQAAACLTGRRVLEIADARASRWLALDNGTLTLDTHAIAVGRDEVQVRLIERGAPAPLPAFEARGRVASVGLSVRLKPDTTTLDRLAAGRRPSRWDVADFYSRYAFHGPSFRGLSEVTSIGPTGIEANLRTTALPGLPTAALHLDPAMLDCAGQLVAFWLLEARRMEPTSGIIPIAARRVIITRPPAPPGTPIRCRGTIALARGTTEASFVFETLDGQTLLAMEGFVQRLVELPAWLAGIIFGGASVATAPARLTDADREALRGHWGIWARALAHLEDPIFDRSDARNEHDDAR